MTLTPEDERTVQEWLKKNFGPHNIDKLEDELEHLEEMAAILKAEENEEQ